MVWLQRRRGVVTALLSLLLAVPLQSTQPATPLSDDAIRTILRKRIDVEKRHVGVVVGVLEPQGRRVIAHGRMGASDSKVVDGQTVFEIGSVTKVFTSLALADMVGRGEVSLDDPVAKYLPATVKVPERDGRVITLLDLATHSSGLPRLPSNLRITNPLNPYADYSVQQMYDFLAGHTLSRAIGSQYEYSNLAVGLLGHALALHAGGSYDALVKTRVSTPLRLNDTSVALTESMASRMARGHNAKLEPVSNWDIPTLAGAGALKSTVNDLLQFLAVFVDPPPAFAPVAARMLAVRRPTVVPNMQVALGWHITKRDDIEIIWHNGGTGGFNSFIGFVPERKIGVVVLSNATVGPVTGIDDIALHLLDASAPLTSPPAARVRVGVPPAILANYAGRYELAPGFVATVIHEDGRLFVQPQGQQRHEIFAESERRFFATIADAQFTFEVDASGRATAMVLEQAGKRVVGKRIE